MAHRKMFTVGPVEVSPEILEEMSRPMIGHRTKECYALYANLKRKLQQLLHTKNRCFIFASSSTGVMEGCVRNLVAKRCLCVVNGAFSERWYDVAVTNGKPADRLDFPWGEPADAAKINQMLATGKYDALTIVHNETSTGVMTPLERISVVMKKHPGCMFCVDAVTSMAAIDINVDALGIDVIFAGVQKAFALPPGMAVAAISQKALDRAAQVPDRGYYFDFIDHLKYYEKDQYQTTPPISLMFALDKQLDRIAAEGPENRYRRHQDMAKMARQWAHDHGFTLFPKAGAESVTLTCIRHDGKVDFKALKAKLADRNLEISEGYGKLKDTTFRIGHMGDINHFDLKELLLEMELCL